MYNSFYKYTLYYITNIYICFSTISCTITDIKSVNKNEFITNISEERSKEIIDSLVFNENIQPIELSQKERILAICDSLNGTLEIESNYSDNINKILTFTKVPLRSAYCGATVKYILETAGIKYDVKNPEWASNNFIDKQKIIYQKGKWLKNQDLLVGYVTGYRLGNSNRINHVGIYIKTNDNTFTAFEGNTTNPKNKKEQGFFYKNRSKKITYIREI